MMMNIDESSSDEAKSPPKVTFTISSSPPPMDEIEDDDEDFDEACSPDEKERYWLTVANPLHQIRRLSDVSLRNARNQIRRFSNSGSKLLKNSYLHRLLSIDQDRNSGGNLSPPDANLRKGSADPMSILKAAQGLEYCSRNHGHGFARKSVSFCQRDNVHVYDTVEYDEDDLDANVILSSDESEQEESDKSLVPCFVFPGKKPNYNKIFDANTMILESLDINEEDMCVMGNVRVNFSKLQQVAANQKRVTVVAKYTTDDWVTSHETKAMIVKAQPHPALSHFITRAMRFYIDCDDLNVGDVLKFSIMCYASAGSKTAFLLATDDNDTQYYQVNCTPKLNVWAAKAAQELKNLAPIVKYNCLHKDPSSTTETVNQL